MCHSCPLTSNHYTLLEACPLSRSLALHLTITQEFSWSRGSMTSTVRRHQRSPLFSLANIYVCNRSTLDIGVLGYIGIVWPKEHSPEVWSVPPVTPCITEGILCQLHLWISGSCEYYEPAGSIKSRETFFYKWLTLLKDSHTYSYKITNVQI